MQTITRTTRTSFSRKREEKIKKKQYQEEKQVRSRTFTRSLVPSFTSRSPKQSLTYSMCVITRPHTYPGSLSAPLHPHRHPCTLTLGHTHTRTHAYPDTRTTAHPHTRTRSQTRTLTRSHLYTRTLAPAPSSPAYQFPPSINLWKWSVEKASIGFSADRKGSA